MDFFNYAGIHRPVKLYAVPADIYLDEIFVTTSFDVDKNTAQLTFDLLVRHFCLCILFGLQMIQMHCCLLLLVLVGCHYLEFLL